MDVRIWRVSLVLNPTLGLGRTTAVNKNKYRSVQELRSTSMLFRNFKSVIYLFIKFKLVKVKV